MPTDGSLNGNEIIEAAIERFGSETTAENFTDVLKGILLRMRQDGHFLIPVAPPQTMLDQIDPETAKVGDTFVAEEELHFRIHTLTSRDGKVWLPAFTSRAEFEKGGSASVISNFIDAVLKMTENAEDLAGIVLNPFGTYLLLDQKAIHILLHPEDVG